MASGWIDNRQENPVPIVYAVFHPAHTGDVIPGGNCEINFGSDCVPRCGEDDIDQGRCPIPDGKGCIGEILKSVVVDALQHYQIGLLVVALGGYDGFSRLTAVDSQIYGLLSRVHDHPGFRVNDEHSQSKADHIRINLEEDVQFPHLTTGLERYRFRSPIFSEL